MKPASTTTPTEYLESEIPKTEEIGTHTFIHQDIEELLQVLYNHGKKGLREVDIVNEYIKCLFTVENIEYSYADKQPSVHKALKTLEKKHKVIKENRRYFLVQPDNTKEIAEKTLMQKVRLYKKAMFTVSTTTVVLYPTDDTINIAQEWFAKYLGSSCYGIAKVDGYLVIMLVGPREARDELRKDIKRLATAIYERHSK